MSNTTAAVPRNYTAWVSGRTLRGPARQILSQIQRDAKPESKVGKISLEKYADTLIEGGSLFFPDGSVPEFLVSQEFPTRFDRALEYLAAMPASGVRIIARK